MAPSTHSHSHSLQNRTFQVPFPYQGQIFLFYSSICFKVTVYTNGIINFLFFFYFRILTHFQVSITHF